MSGDHDEASGWTAITAAMRLWRRFFEMQKATSQRRFRLRDRRRLRAAERRALTRGRRAALQFFAEWRRAGCHLRHDLADLPTGSSRVLVRHIGVEWGAAGYVLVARMTGRYRVHGVMRGFCRAPGYDG